MNQRELKWADLSDPVKTIIEHIDINRCDEDFQIGTKLSIPYFKGRFTQEMADAILEYQFSTENVNEGSYSAELLNNVLSMKFLKREL
ncbi:hypothetical protein [Paenibacillus andongensis]|uniref:hypothetical protein n=1 Tax=Paenibacillus andongensis TaxID=2975482 RepID=UPI0021BB5AAB|nr:hypothetical protein [Paenibacillus andongensis]